MSDREFYELLLDTIEFGLARAKEWGKLNKTRPCIVRDLKELRAEVKSRLTGYVSTDKDRCVQLIDLIQRDQIARRKEQLTFARVA